MMEAIMGAVISVIAVLGLAYSFGVGRGMVERFSVARAALATVDARMEGLTLLTPSTSPSLAIGYASPPSSFVFNGATIGTESWNVAGYDEPNLAGSANLRLVTVRVVWRQGAVTDSVRIQRLFPL